MKILFVVHGYPPTHNGGAERRAERTARGFFERGHDVHVLCFEALTRPSDEHHWDDCVQRGVKVRRLYFNPGHGSAPFHWSYDNPTVGELLTALIHEWRPDVIHLFSGYLMSASIVRVAVANDIRVVVSLTDYWWLCHRINLLRTDGTRCAGPTATSCARCQAEVFRRYRLPAQVLPHVAEKFWTNLSADSAFSTYMGVAQQQQRAVRLLEILRSADVLIAPSRYLATMYMQHGIDAAQIRVWRQGVELDYCLLPQSDPVFRVGYMGQIKPHKGVHLLLEAWSQLQGQRARRLQLYGSDHGEETYGHQIRKTISRLEHVAWQGQFTESEVWQVLAQLDVLVVPSRWVENSPNTILEAQAVGVPVVGSNLGGVAELIAHEQNGLLFEVDDPADLARQLQRLLDDPELVQRLRHAETPFLSHNESLTQTEELYDQITSMPPRTPLPSAYTDVDMVTTSELT